MLAFILDGNCMLLRDSWSGFGKPEELETRVPEGKSTKVKVTPENTTDMIQPLDVYGNRYLYMWYAIFHYASGV